MGGRAVNISTYEFWQDKSIEIITLSLHSGKKKKKCSKRLQSNPYIDTVIQCEVNYFIGYQVWLCQVSLFLFLGSYLVATKIQSDGPKGTEQQTSYNSVRLKQTGLLLDTSTGVLLIFLINHAWLQPFRLLSSSQCKVELVSTTSNEREWKWAYTQGQVTI